MVTIKITVPDIIETRAFTKAKGEPGRVETAKVMQHKPGEWHESVLLAKFIKGVQRYENDYYSSESDPVVKAGKIAGMVAAFNDGRTLTEVLGKAPRAAAVATDPVLIRARQLARKVLKSEMDKAAYKAAYTDADPADQLAALNAWMDSDPRGAKVRALAAKQIADEAALSMGESTDD